MAAGDREGYLARRRAQNRNTEVTPLGSRREFTERVRGLVAESGDRVREDFAAEDVVRDYCEAIRSGIKARDRTALNLYAQTMKLVGEERRITVEFIHSLGASSEDELRRMVEAVKAAEGADVLDGVERAAAYLEAALQIHPEHRQAVVLRLGGVVPRPGSERV